MKTYKYTDASRTVAHVIDEDGKSRISRLVSELPEGTVIQAADPPPSPSQDEQDIIAAKAYAKLVALRGMTPAQVQSWVDANVTNLAQAQDVIKTLAIAVSILIRRL